VLVTFVSLTSSSSSPVLQEFSKLRSDVLALLTSTAESTLKLTNQLTDADVADKGRALSLRDQSRLFRDTTLQTVNKLSEQVEQCLNDVRAQVACMEDQVSTWAGKITNQLEEAQRSSEEYCSAVTAELNGVDEYVGAASAEQGTLIDKHKIALAEHLRAEKAASSAAAEKLQEDIRIQIERLVAEHTKTATRRLEAAVMQFQTSAESLTTSELL
jgi:hypothetical protein